MRIISGEHRGRKLLGPADENTRPITDRVKTAVFDRLAAAGLLEGAVVADLFAGTGSLGVECLSRGAAHVLFVERDRDARQRLEQNLAMIEATDRATVYGGDALSATVIAMLEHRKPTLIFVDPPYRFLTDGKSAARVYEQIQRLGGIAAADAWLMLRVEEHVQMEPVAGWIGPDPRKYGSMVVGFYQLAPRQ